MKTDINLIDVVARKGITFRRFRKKIQTISFFVLVVFIFLCLGIFGGFFFLNSKLSADKVKISSIKNQINTLRKTESYMVTISNRVGTINSLLKNRNLYLKTINDLKLIIVAGFEPQSLEISRDGSLKINGLCADNPSLKKFTESVEKIQQENKYSQVLYPSVSRLGNGRYYVALELKK